MRKKIKVLAVILILTMLTSTAAFAADGSDSCTFTTSNGSTGVGYLTVNSSRITGRTTIPTGTGNAIVTVNYSYKKSDGTYDGGRVNNTALQTTSAIKDLPSGTSSRRGDSIHTSTNTSDKGYCTLN